MTNDAKNHSIRLTKEMINKVRRQMAPIPNKSEIEIYSRVLNRKNHPLSKNAIFNIILNVMR